MKLALEEPESGALKAHLSVVTVRYSSDLARVEVPRALSRQVASVYAAELVLARLRLIGVTRRILEDAARIPPSSIRSLDAIHLASALSLGDELEAIVTYDLRMQDAARALGMTVAAPA